MKQDDHILTLKEIETLCQLYLECQLSVLEEKELEYILINSPYNSPLIDEARESMMAEDLLFLEGNKKEVIRKRSGIKWIRSLSWVAASFTLLFVVSIFIGNQLDNNVSSYAKNQSSYKHDREQENIVIAYEGGKQLDFETSEKAVDASMKKAEALMAMAKAIEQEDELRQESFTFKFNKE